MTTKLYSFLLLSLFFTHNKLIAEQNSDYQAYVGDVQYWLKHSEYAETTEQIQTYMGMDGWKRSAVETIAMGRVRPFLAKAPVELVQTLLEMRSETGETFERRVQNIQIFTKKCKHVLPLLKQHISQRK